MALITLKEILADADQRRYAVGMFNTTNIEMIKGIIGAAEQESSPVIIALAEVHLPYGSVELLGPLMVDAAKKASVPVVVHLDHGMSYTVMVNALHHGFTSIMYDGSTLPYEENIANTAEIVKLAKVFGCSVEAELGHVGGTEGGGIDEQEEAYTNPEQAQDFVTRSGADALAVAIGTAHGEYVRTPKLDLDRLSAIRAKVSVPLVLHGGSGLSEDDFRECIRRGVSKINIFTEMSNAAVERIRQEVKAKISYPDLMLRSIEGIKETVVAKMRLFGSSGRA